MRPYSAEKVRLAYSQRHHTLFDSSTPQNVAAASAQLRCGSSTTAGLNVFDLFIDASVFARANPSSRSTRQRSRQATVADTFGDVLAGGELPLRRIHHQLVETVLRRRQNTGRTLYQT